MILCWRCWSRREILGKSFSGKEHSEPAGTDRGDVQSEGTLQKDRAGSRSRGPPAGGGVPPGSPGGATRNHFGPGRDRRSAARAAGRAFLPRLLRTLLLPTVVHLLRRVPAVCAVAVLEHRCVGRKC